MTTAELAGRPDFTLGLAAISPSSRTIAGPGGTADVEPRVMQVLVVLADAAGQVVTRDTLFHRCWGGVYVGDDSLNRAIGAVRKIAADIAGGSFEIETVPRTGYRLVGEVDLPEQPSGILLADGSRIPRRTVIAGALVAAGTGALGLWGIRRSQEERQFDDLMDRGRQALSYGDPTADPAAYFRRAVAMRPGDSRAQGLLACSEAVYGDPRAADDAMLRADRAARAALAIDPSEPNARLALTVLHGSMLDFAATEDRLRAILATAPADTLVMRLLWGFLQSTGQSRASLALIERALAIEPLAAANNFPRAQLLWILGRTAEADRVIDNAIQIWPSHPSVRFARFMILAFTGRPRAALAMLDDARTRPQDFSPEMISLLRVSLRALDQRTAASIAAARSANLEAARRNPGLSNFAVEVLSVLGDVDDAFEIANGLLLFRRPIELRSQAPAKPPPIRSTGWRFSPWLFTPPLAPLRADPRFKVLCDGIGLTQYWAKRGIKPDYQLGIT